LLIENRFNRLQPVTTKKYPCRIYSSSLELYMPIMPDNATMKVSTLLLCDHDRYNMPSLQLISYEQIRVY